MKQRRISMHAWSRRLAVAALLGLSGTAEGAPYLFSDQGPGNFSASASDLGQVITDNNLSGVAYSLSFGTAGLAIDFLTVTFNISGGYNGDLYAYLGHDSSTLVLLNRVGVSSGSTYGYADPGFDVTLTDTGTLNIHAYGGNGASQLSGSFRADGQTTSPLAASSSFTAGGGSATFESTFGGLDPGGDWILFFADASGGSVSTLNSWSVVISTVPEPANVALGVFAGLLAACRFIAGSGVSLPGSGPRCKDSRDKSRMD